MRRPSALLLALVAAGALAARAAAQPPGGTPRGPGAFAPDPVAAQRDSIVAELQKLIAGREQAPAESVFKDIQVLKGMTAERVLRVMNMGFSRSLGVSCAHCHDPADWAASRKPQKQVARAMWGMVQTINQDMLAKIPDLHSQPATVNCTTCHRGQARPGGR